MLKFDSFKDYHSYIDNHSISTFEVKSSDNFDFEVFNIPDGNKYYFKIININEVETIGKHSYSFVINNSNKIRVHAPDINTAKYRAIIKFKNELKS